MASSKFRGRLELLPPASPSGTGLSPDFFLAFAKSYNFLEGLTIS